MDNEEIEKQIQNLRNGGDLNEQAVEAIAVGIAKKFEDLAEVWGKRFSIGGWVDLQTSTPCVLYFCKRHISRNSVPRKNVQNTWVFIISFANTREERRIFEVNFEIRIAAAKAIPELKKVLEGNSDKNRNELLEAYDTISKYT